MTRTCTQTAVYWGTPTPDGYGGFTFATAVEISCRWEDRTGVFMSDRGEQEYSKGVVYVLQDLDEDGYLYLGELTDLDSDEITDPKSVDGAFIVKRFDKIPALKSTTKFVRKAHL